MIGARVYLSDPEGFSKTPGQSTPDEMEDYILRGMVRDKRGTVDFIRQRAPEFRLMGDDVIEKAVLGDWMKRSDDPSERAAMAKKDKRIGALERAEGATNPSRGFHGEELTSWQENIGSKTPLVSEVVAPDQRIRRTFNTYEEAQKARAAMPGSKLAAEGGQFFLMNPQGENVGQSAGPFVEWDQGDIDIANGWQRGAGMFSGNASPFQQVVANATEGRGLGGKLLNLPSPFPMESKPARPGFGLRQLGMERGSQAAELLPDGFASKAVAAVTPAVASLGGTVGPLWETLKGNVIQGLTAPFDPTGALRFQQGEESKAEIEKQMRDANQLATQDSVDAEFLDSIHPDVLSALDREAGALIGETPGIAAQQVFPNEGTFALQGVGSLGKGAVGKVWPKIAADPRMQKGLSIVSENPAIHAVDDPAARDVLRNAQQAYRSAPDVAAAKASGRADVPMPSVPTEEEMKGLSAFERRKLRDVRANESELDVNRRMSREGVGPEQRAEEAYLTYVRDTPVQKQVSDVKRVYMSGLIQKHPQGHLSDQEIALLKEYSDEVSSGRQEINRLQDMRRVRIDELDNEVVSAADNLDRVLRKNGVDPDAVGVRPRPELSPEQMAEINAAKKQLEELEKPIKKLREDIKKKSGTDYPEAGADKKRTFSVTVGKNESFPMLQEKHLKEIFEAQDALRSARQTVREYSSVSHGEIKERRITLQGSIEKYRKAKKEAAAKKLKQEDSDIVIPSTGNLELDKKLHGQMLPQFEARALQYMTNPAQHGKDFADAMEKYLVLSGQTRAQTRDALGFDPFQRATEFARIAVAHPNWADKSVMREVVEVLNSPIGKGEKGQLHEQLLRELDIGRSGRAGAGADDGLVPELLPVAGQNYVTKEGGKLDKVVSAAAAPIARLKQGLAIPGRVGNKATDWILRNRMFPGLNKDVPVEDAFRVWAVLLSRRAGVSLPTAINRSNQLLVNFSKDTPFIRIAKPFSPYIKWHLGAAQGAAEMAIRNPGRFKILANSGRFAEELDRQYQGDGAPINAKLKNDSETVSGTPLVQMPGETGSYSTVTPPTPLAETAENLGLLYNTVANFKSKERYRDKGIADDINPAIGSMYTMMSGRDADTGKSLVAQNENIASSKIITPGILGAFETAIRQNMGQIDPRLGLGDNPWSAAMLHVMTGNPVSSGTIPPYMVRILKTAIRDIPPEKRTEQNIRNYVVRQAYSRLLGIRSREVQPAQRALTEHAARGNQVKLPQDYLIGQDIESGDIEGD